MWGLRNRAWHVQYKLSYYKQTHYCLELFSFHIRPSSSIQRWPLLGEQTSRKTNKWDFFCIRFASFLLPYIFGHAVSRHLIPWFCACCSFCLKHLSLSSPTYPSSLSSVSAPRPFCRASDLHTPVTPSHGAPSPQITAVWTWVSFTGLWAPEDGGSCVYFPFHLAPRI